ncbi:MAG: hypothetical protein ACRCXT_08845 [Paraclostridium sp.]
MKLELFKLSSTLEKIDRTPRSIQVSLSDVSIANQSKERVAYYQLERFFVKFNITDQKTKEKLFRIAGKGNNYKNLDTSSIKRLIKSGGKDE